MTGVRGVGKTSTARLIAKALNCVGPDGQGGPTIDPAACASRASPSPRAATST
jgi:DNA polymerase III gamma/tau subunit